MKLKEHEAELMNNISIRIREIADMMEELRPAGGFREAIEGTTPKPSKLNLPTAEERAMELFTKKQKDIPPLAMEYVKYLSNKYGGCGEVFLTGAAHYAQAIEGLKSTDALYSINKEGIEWFRNHKDK